jgi:hypothetical protein
MKNAIFWDLTLCGSCKNQHFGGMYGLHHQGDKSRQARNNIVFLHSMLWLLVTANVIPSSPILVTLMMEEIHSSKMSVLTRDTP